MDIHAGGFRENIDGGVLATLEPAADAGWISADELERQRYLLAKANEVERLRGGAASRAYIEPERGDLKHVAAKRLVELADSGATGGVAIMNAKKETAYMFADELIALHDACPDAAVTYVANLEDRGLPKVREDAGRILAGMRERGGRPPRTPRGRSTSTGANGTAIGERLREINPDFALIVGGVPHAVPPEYTEGIEVFSITNGPRQVAPLREMGGHRHVMVEIDLHPKTLASGISSQASSGGKSSGACDEVLPRRRRPLREREDEHHSRALGPPLDRPGRPDLQGGGWTTSTPPPTLPG